MLREDTSCSFKLLKCFEEITEPEKRYGRYRYKNTAELFYDGQGYYIARNWGVGNIDKFIAAMESQFAGLSYAVTVSS